MGLGTLIRAFVALATLGGFAIAGVAVVYVLMKVRREGTGSTAGWATQVLDAINAGDIPAAERAVLANGWIAEAMILDRNDVNTVAKNRTMVYHLIDFVLEVRIPGHPPYRAPCRQEFISSEAYRLTQGEVVPVRVDASNPQVVYIDREARKR